MPQNGFGGRKANAWKYLALTSTALVGLGQPIAATAAETWTGAASTNWFTAGNWNPAAVPTSSDDVTLNATFPNPAVINAANAAAHTLFMGTIASYTGSLTITNGGTLTDTAAFVGYVSNSGGSVNVGAGSVWSNSSDLFLALGSNSTGTLTISNGGIVSDTVGHIGSGQGTGTVTVGGIGSTWTNSGDLYIAEFGVGTLNIANGGKVSDVTGTIGWHAGSNGSVTVDGAGAASTWTNSSHLFVGDQGTGKLAITDGGKVGNLSGIVGNLAGSTGTVTVDGAGSTWANAALAVGNAGIGALTISNGGTVTSSVGYAAYDVGSAGTVVVAGTGSTWTNTSDLFVGFQGSGTLQIGSGGKVNNTSGNIGTFAGSTGTVFVDNSTWTNSGSLSVGDSGTGTLAISHGGGVSSSGGAIGANAGSTGTVFVENAGSTWTNSSNLAVGDFGTGTLAISHGGAVSNDRAYVGKSAGSTGTVIVDDSTWTNSGSLIVGDFGKGALEITLGGAVSNSWATVGAKAGSTGIVFVDGIGSSWTNSSNLAIGDFGAGTLQITNGGAVTNAWGYIGDSAGSTGAVAVDGTGSKWTNTGNLYVGGLSTGTLTISNGGAVSSEDLSVGYQGTGTLNILNGGKLTNQAAILGELGTATATVTVDGAGSSWSTDDDLTVGAGGHGTLVISNGGSADADSVVVGGGATSAGAVTVDGMGSKWTNKNGLYLGAYGSGTLAVTNGGVASGGFAYMAMGADVASQATVDGTDSLWEMHGDLLIGFDGTASVTLSNGGSVVNIDGYLGFDAGSIGMANVSGPGSTWTSSGDLNVGVSGTGTLTVANGGSVNGGILTIGDSGSGTLAVSNGGKVNSADGVIGVAATGVGTATVDGAGSTWSSGLALYVGNSGTGTLTISNGGKVTSALGVLGDFSGSQGTATVTGAGSTWTNGSNLFVGLTGSATLAIANGGTVTNNEGHIGDVAGALGKVTVDGTNSTWISLSDLVVGSAGTGTLDISNDGAVSVGGKVAIAKQVGSAGTLNIGGAPGTAAAAPGTLNAASVQFGTGAGAINFNHTGTNYAFASSIGGAGTINQIAGNTNLTADSSGFTGATNVDGGRLAVNGSLANSLVTILGGVLGGNGTVGGIVAQSGGIVAPGNSIGTLNVAGNIDQAAGSIYQVELTSTGQSDLIHATGTATIAAGAILDMVKTDAAPYVPGTHYTVLQADAGVTGTYTISGLGLFTGLYANYDPTHVYIDAVQAKSFADVGLTPNQIATGGGAESLGGGNPLFDAIFALPSEAVVRDAFDQLSGEIHASAKGMLLEDSRFVRDAATNRIAAAFGDVGSAALPVMAYGEGGPEIVAADTDRFAVWGQAFGSWGNTDSDGNAAAFDRSTGGLLAGADTLLGGWRIGLLGGYSHSSFDADDRNSSGKSDSYHLGLYGGTNWGAIAFRTGAAYSWSSLSTKRTVAFNGFTDGLSADYDAGTAQVFGELAYKADAGHFKFEPFANLAYVSVRTDGFTETGGAAALTSAGSTTDATFATLGLRGSTDFALGGINATARGMLGWRHAFGDVTPISSFAFAGGDAFTIAGVPIARDAAVVEAGLDLNMSANATLGVSYSGQFGGGTVDQGAKVDLGIKF
ncbi:autotransporter domain-containing protein [Mesorhizobium sp.]|uniref:autotransporter domain-containing protein n=1 Tax=Mesorhizobium sp. TaxID=1871066 RepID=UPI0025BA01A4|nr:autotransporter domain-containing protein [Mesorhizobium sp.]